MRLRVLFPDPSVWLISRPVSLGHQVPRELHKHHVTHILVSDVHEIGVRVRPAQQAALQARGWTEEREGPCLPASLLPPGFGWSGPRPSFPARQQLWVLRGSCEHFSSLSLLVAPQQVLGKWA